MNHCVVKHRTCKTKIVHWCPVQGNVLAFGHLLLCLKDAKHGWNVRKVEFSNFRLLDFSNFRFFEFSNFRIVVFHNSSRVFEFSIYLRFRMVEKLNFRNFYFSENASFLDFSHFRVFEFASRTLHDAQTRSLVSLNATSNPPNPQPLKPGAFGFFLVQGLATTS